MKKITFLLTFLFASTLMLAQTVALEESFETDGNGTRYTTTTPEFTDGFNDFFIKTKENPNEKRMVLIKTTFLSLLISSKFLPVIYEI